MMQSEPIVRPHMRIVRSMERLKLVPVHRRVNHENFKIQTSPQSSSCRTDGDIGADGDSERSTCRSIQHWRFNPCHFRERQGVLLRPRDQDEPFDAGTIADYQYWWA